MRKLALILLSLCGFSPAWAAMVFDGVPGTYAERTDTVPKPFTAYPFTFAGWFQSNTAHSGVAVSWASDGSIDRLWTCGLNSGDNTTRVNRRNGGGGQLAYSSIPYTLGTTWYHLSCTFNDTLGEVYLDGGNRGENTASVSFSTASDTTSMGRIGDSSPSNEFNGKLAYWTMWNVILNSTQISGLASGDCPSDVANANIVAYWPMDTDGGAIIDDTIGTFDLTISGNVTFDGADNPPGVCGAPAPSGHPRAVTVYNRQMRRR